MPTKPTCSIEGCTKPVLARGWCGAHWARWKRNGTPGTTLVRSDDIDVRFWEKVLKTEGCWVWQGSKSEGYGKFSLNNRPVWAHRVAYEREVGPIPDGLTIDHICRNRACVRPDHLRAVTQKQNNENHSGKALPNNRTSGIRGVSWSSSRNKWSAIVWHQGRQNYFGYFDNLEDAAIAVREGRNKLFTHNDADRGTR